MKLGYIASPYRDSRGAYYIEQNIRRAESAGLELMQAGFAVIIPHKNTEHMVGPVTDDQILAVCLEIVKRCDFLVLVGDWNRSEGARMERSAAIGARVRVYGSVKEAIEWENK